MRLHYFFLFLATVFVLYSCRPELDLIEGPPSSDAVVSASGETFFITFSSASGSSSVNLKASGKWTAEFVNDRARDWCSLSSENGKRGTVVITVSVKENAEYDERLASIVFTCKDAKKTIVVTQKQKDALLVTRDRFDMGKEGGRIEVEINANLGYGFTISEEAKDWIKPVETKSLAISKLCFEISENDAFQKREGQILISSSIGTEIVRVYQECDTPTLILSSNNYSFDAEAGSFQVEVRSNLDVSFVIPSNCKWIRELTTKAISTNTFYFIVDENENFTERSCNIVFKSLEWGLEEAVLVEQKAAVPQLIMGTGLYEFSAEGGPFDIELRSNYDVVASVPDTCGWIRPVETKAMTDKAFHFIVEANESFDSREGIVVLYNEALSKRECVTVRQEADVPTIIMGETSYDFDAKGGPLNITLQSNFGVTASIPDSCAWIRAVETKALTDKVFHFTVDANESFSKRGGAIVFFNSLLNKRETVTVRQEADVPTIIMGETSYDFDAKGGPLNIELISNMELDSEIGPYNCDWIIPVTTKALMSKTHYFSVLKNHGRARRQGWIVFQNDAHDYSDTVFINQAFQPILYFPCDTLRASGRGWTVSFETVGTNPSDYRIESEDNWITLMSQENVPNGSRFFLDIQEAEGMTNRDGRVQVFFKDYDVPDTVFVRQYGKLPTFSFTTSSHKVQLPVIEGDNQFGFVFWGDGANEPFMADIFHEYIFSGMHTVTVEVRSKKRVSFTGLEDGMTINLRELRNQ